MSEQPKRITVHRRLRPIRLAFLVRHGDLMALCDVSQQLHLGMESYASRQHEYFKSRSGRKARKAQ
jgi:hypothetical protein